MDCRVCASSRTRFLCTTPNEHSATSILSHYRCRDCGSVFVGNPVTTDELATAYATLDSGPYYAEIEREECRKMASAIVDLAHLAKHAAIIDIGTGNALFLRQLKAEGFSNLSGHDMQEVKADCPIYCDHDYHTVPSASFDCATLLDVVEHVPDPTYLFNACNRILKADGVIYFHTPVVTRIDRLMHLCMRVPVLGKIARMWQRGRTSIFHLENYTPKALTMLLRNAGFSDITVTVRNELSWPVSKYVRAFLIEKYRLPRWLTPALTPFVYPLLATRLNANKAIVMARKCHIACKTDRVLREDTKQAA